MTRPLLTFLAIAVVLSSCRSVSFFETPNAVKNMPGTVYLVNGRSYYGNLYVHTSRLSNSAVKLYTQGDKKPMRFGIHHIKGYKLKNSYYELKEVRGGIRLGKEYSFMKRLTKKDSRIHLFENVRKVTHAGGKHTGSYTTYETEYYLQLPGDDSDAVWSLSSSKFVPDFNEKMSQLVNNCPVLATKISNKEEGYFYAQVSLLAEKKVHVLMNIIEEYNRCSNM